MDAQTCWSSISRLTMSPLQAAAHISGGKRACLTICTSWRRGREPFQNPKTTAFHLSENLAWVSKVNLCIDQPSYLNLVNDEQTNTHKRELALLGHPLHCSQYPVQRGGALQSGLQSGLHDQYTGNVDVPPPPCRITAQMSPPLPPPPADLTGADVEGLGDHLEEATVSESEPALVGVQH